MHELSIAMNIVEIVEEQLNGSEAVKVEELELDIGNSSGVIIEALRFALEEAIKSSILENADIIINEIPSKCKCISCAHEFVPEDIITPCPKCGHLYSDVISGKEMKIRRIRFSEE
ncbi:MAG: hydrogenase maturation nickel metallochaperone HypA [Bacteroidota bacterium]